MSDQTCPMFDRSPLMKIPPLMRDDLRSVVDDRNTVYPVLLLVDILPFI